MGLIANLLRKWNSRKTKLIKEPKWVTVLQSTDEYIVRIQKLKLEDHGIQVILFNQRDSSYNTFGYIYLNVRPEDELKALNLIENSNE